MTGQTITNDLLQWTQKVLRADIPPKTRMVAAAIGVSFAYPGGKMIARPKGLSNILGMPRKRMRKALSQLEKRGWLARVKIDAPRGRVWIRTITFPRDLAGG